MTCDSYAEKIPEYIRGKLPEAEAKNLEAHVATCAHCREEMGDLEWFGAGARSNAQRIAEGHIASRLLYEFAEEPDALEPDTITGIEEHLRSCESCRQENDLILSSLARETPAIDGEARTWRRPRVWLGGRPLRTAFAGLAVVLVVAVSIFLVRYTARGPTYDVRVVAAGSERTVLDVSLSDVVRGGADAPPATSLSDIASDSIALRLEIDVFEGEALPATVALMNSIGEVVREVQIPSPAAAAGTIVLLLDKRSFTTGRYTVDVRDTSGVSMGWADIDL